MAYNLKEHLKFIEKHSKSGAASLSNVRFALKAIPQYVLRLFKPYNFRVQAIYTVK
ncbi:hypothetical protein GCM10022395_02790 [Snuella lapsa]|uniref:Transposase n=1 Tax=Snuella lapsa TaxID=870481 RepID=A0ABP6WRQ1_9FLAO